MSTNPADHFAFGVSMIIFLSLVVALWRLQKGKKN